MEHEQNTGVPETHTPAPAAPPSAQPPYVPGTPPYGVPGQNPGVQPPVNPWQPPYPQNAQPPYASYGQPQNAYVPYRKPPEPPLSDAERRRGAIFVGVFFIVCYLWCDFVFFGGMGLGNAITMAALLAAGVGYLSRGGLRPARDGVALLASCALLGVSLLLFDNELLVVLDLLALIALLPLGFTYFAGHNEFRFGRFGMVWDALKSVFFFPLCNLGKAGRMLSGTGRSRVTRTLLTVLVGVLIALPVAAVVITLLMSADSTFERIVRHALDLIGSRWMRYVGRAILAALLTFPVFSFFYSLRAKNRDARIHEPGNPAPADKMTPHVVDVTIVNSALWVISMIYVLYMATQFAYFFSALVGTLPAGWESHAQYARRGFFELVTVAAINLALIAASVLFSKRKRVNGRPVLRRASRVTIFALAALTLMLIVTAASKMALYIRFFGLTQLRVYTSWFMLVLAAVFILVVIKMFTDRLNLLRVSTFVSLLLFLALNFANVDGMIAGYNVARYRAQITAGVKVEIDLDTLSLLSSSAIPAIATLADDPSCGEQARTILQNYESRHGKEKWQEWTFSGWQAQRAAEKALER